MDGIITMKGSREIVEKLKAWRAKAASDASKEEKKESTIDTAVDVTKIFVKAVGNAVTMTLSICSLGGTLGKALVALTKPAFVKAVESSRGLLKAAYVTKDSEQIKAVMADVYGNVKEISIKDEDLVQTVSKEQTAMDVVGHYIKQL